MVELFLSEEGIYYLMMIIDQPCFQISGRPRQSDHNFALCEVSVQRHEVRITLVALSSDIEGMVCKISHPQKRSH